MKVICDRAALLDAINLVSGAVAARTPRIQLTCVKLTASQVKTKTGTVGELALAATDAEIALNVRLGEVDVQKAGEALIPADKLRQIISAEDNEPTLTIEVDKDICHIRGADAHFKVFGQQPAEFPPIPTLETLPGGKPKGALSMTAGALGALIARTLFATARENSRYAINGVLFKREGKRVEMVATDGRRLALARTSVPAEKDAAPITCIIPTKALAQLQKLVHDPEEPVHIAVTDNQILFSFGGENNLNRAVLVSNLVEGAFPPYEDVIPKDQDKKISFDRDTLTSAVRRAALLTNEESRGVRMAFSGGKKQLELSSRAPEMGESEIKVDLAGYDGEDIEIGFNPHFIIEALKVLNDPQVIMELKAPNKPGLIKSGTDFQYVVMPVNLQ